MDFSGSYTKQETTPEYNTACGTPQDSPLSPVLYTLYLAALINHDTKLRFEYADEICIYRANHSIGENVRLLARDAREIIRYGEKNTVCTRERLFSTGR